MEVEPSGREQILRTPRSRRALVGLLFVVAVFVVIPVVAMLLAGS
jgi:hypothetical protein